MTISLLRSPKSPDPQADMGKHRFSFAIYPHEHDWRRGQVLREAVAFNAPLLRSDRAIDARSFIQVEDDTGAFVLDTVKQSEDGQGSVLRFFESFGGRGVARVRIGLPFKDAVYCNVLEDESDAVQRDGETLVVPFAPFQIVSIKVT